MLVYDVHIFYYFSIYWSDTSLGLSRHVKKNSKDSWIPEGHMSDRSLGVDRKGQNRQHEGSVSAKNEEI